MVISKNILDEVISNIDSGNANYQRFVLVITTDFKCKLECDHTIYTLDSSAIDDLGNAVIQHCKQHYNLDYTAQYAYEFTKRIDMHIKKSINPEDFIKHGFWSEISTGNRVGDYYFTCSECHKNTPDKAYLIAPDYCPHCGAMMDGKEIAKNDVNSKDT